MKSGLEALRQVLNVLPVGPVDRSRISEIERLLAKAWDELEGSWVEDTTGYKLLNRTEDLTWDPPLLSFTIERHGRTALSSTRAEINEWTINLENGVASCITGRYRQVYPRDAPVRVGPVAEQVVKSNNRWVNTEIANRI